MSRTLVRTALLYLVLVGVPVAALLGVLRAGRSLEAPQPVAGTWLVEGAGEPAACFGVADEDGIEIEQSGRFLRVHAGGAVAEGRIEGGRVVTELAASGGSCAGAALELEGVRTADGESIGWTASAPRCASCESVRFRTVRKAG
jgi:hypothetical protein